MTVSKSESTKNQARISELLDKLRDKLRQFAIINMQGKIIGYVKDLYLDRNRHLYMVMSKVDESASSPRVLLSSRYIQKVDSPSRSLFVDLTSREYNSLPAYPSRNNDLSKPSEASPTPSVTPSNRGDLGETPASDTTELFPTEASMEVNNESSGESENTPEIVEEEIVRLLEERLVVNRSKRKVGEVVVRKEIETRIVEVPIQREKLIIEQVGAETKQLAEIDLGQGEVTGVDLSDLSSADTSHRSVPSSDNPYTVIGEFLSPKAASNLLEAIALQGKQHGCAKVRVELVVDNPQLQETYQKMFDRCSQR
jgi:uncharacterized protein (TIGR02271 family)